MNDDGDETIRAHCGVSVGECKIFLHFNNVASSDEKRGYLYTRRFIWLFIKLSGGKKRKCYSAIIKMSGEGL